MPIFSSPPRHGGNAEPSGREKISRRELLSASGVAGVMATAGYASAQTLPLQGYNFFDTQEARLIEAIVARLIPRDEHSPGADELGVPIFIDRQLTGPYGAGASTYMQGPFQTGTPQQGFQASWVPAQFYKDALRRFDEVVRARNGGSAFADLRPEQQDAVLQALESGNLDVSPIAGKEFFSLVLANTIEGFFADPIYGGNKDMRAWAMIGFPGVFASYAEHIENHGIEFKRAPVGLATMGGMPPMKH